MSKETDLVSLTVDPNLIQDVLKRRIEAAIVSQLGNGEELIGKAVCAALSAKVNSSGKVSNSRYDNRYDFLELLAENSIREAATAALREWIAEKQDVIKKAVLAELKKPNRQKSIAAAYADALEHSLSCSWRMDCKVNFTNNDD